MHHDVSGDMLLCMRTTIDINEDLLRRAKKKAADEGVHLRNVVEEALRAHLAGRSKPTGYKLRWTTERGELLPGVNLEDRDALFDLMDGTR